MKQSELIAAISALGKGDVDPEVEIGGESVVWVDWDPENSVIIIDTELPEIEDEETEEVPEEEVPEVTPSVVVPNFNN